MREILFCIVSLAGAAVMTALAVTLRPESPLWKWILWGGIGVFVACAVVLLIDIVRPNGRPVLLFGVGTGLALAISCAAAVLLGSTSTNRLLSAAQLAAHLFPDPQMQDEKAYYAYWASPKMIYGWFGDSASREAGTTPPTEKSVTIYLTNSGPGDVRHIKILWGLHTKEPIKNLIEQSGLFKGRITELHDNYLRFVVKREEGENSGGFSFSTIGRNEIPVIADGSTARAILPEAVKYALFLSTLAQAKMIINRRDELIKMTHQMPPFESRMMYPISVDISYETTDGTNVKQTFVIGGVVMDSNISPGPVGSMLEPDGVGAKLGSIILVKQEPQKP
jgi:hypothetical protein